MSDHDDKHRGRRARPERTPEYHPPTARREDHDRDDHERRRREGDDDRHRGGHHPPDHDPHPRRPDHDEHEGHERHEDHDRREHREPRHDEDRRGRHEDREHDRRDDDDPPVRKIVERVWYFGREEDDHRRERDRDRDHDGGGDHGGRGGGHGGGGHGGDGGGRPTRPPGSQTGRLPDGGPLTGGDLNNPLPPGVFPGPRKDLDLPFLFMRANPADLGRRPVVGAPFWESPDIFLLAGVTPSMAPAVPAQLGQIALSGQPNTIYAHVWNFGKSSSNEVIVEFYWCNPSLGIDASTVQIIAQTTARLGSKTSGHNHKLVMCPEPWTPTFVNGGHECLLVRVWDNPADVPGNPKFDASQNRHVAQRNIHVVDTSGGGVGPMGPGGGGGGLPIPAPNPGGPALANPVLIKVGALYGVPAKVSVERVAPHTVPWLQLRTGVRGKFPNMAPPTGVPTLSPPTTGGGGFPVGVGGATQHVTGDDQHVAFSTSDQAPGAGEAHVYRVSAHQNGAVFGGYTIVILG